MRTAIFDFMILYRSKEPGESVFYGAVDVCRQQCDGKNRRHAHTICCTRTFSLEKPNVYTCFKYHD